MAPAGVATKERTKSKVTLSHFGKYFELGNDRTEEHPWKTTTKETTGNEQNDWPVASVDEIQAHREV